MVPGKQAGVAILISNKIDFQPKVIKCNEEGHFIFIKGKFHQERVSILKIKMQKDPKSKHPGNSGHSEKTKPTDNRRR